MTFFRSNPSPPPLETSPSRRHWWIWGALGVILIGMGAAAVPLYQAGKGWRARNLAAEAEQLREQKRYPEAVSKAQAALLLAPTEPAALRVVARLSALSGGAHAETFWKQLLRTPGATPEDRRHAALFALHQNRLGFAGEQITRLLQEAPDQIGTLELATQLALRRNDPVVALAFVERILAQDPRQAFARLNRAQILLLTPDLAKAAPSSSSLRALEATLPPAAAPVRPTEEEVRADLRLLAESAERRVEAFRLLIFEARRRGALEEALRHTGQLLAGPGWSFEDQLLRLDLLTEAKSPELEAAIQGLLQTSGHTLQPAVMLGSWLLAHGRAQQLLAALPTFAAEVRTAAAGKLLQADACAALQRWSEAEAVVKTGPWPRLELQRSVALARALRGQDRTAEFGNVWRDLLKANRSNRVALLQLVKISGAWEWKVQQEELLWKILDGFPAENWVPSMLTNIYASEGRTADLRRLANRLLALNPQNAALKNNLAILSLLLSSEVERATRLAREAYDSQPANSSFTCTYAYALHCGGQKEAALNLMQDLPGEALRHPNTAAYYSAMLRENGDASRAEQYASLALAGRLLPEERKLVTRGHIPHLN